MLIKVNFNKVNFLNGIGQSWPSCEVKELL